MTTIPEQVAGRDICAHPDCGQPIHLVNRALGPEWVHAVSPWCGVAGAVLTTRAVPVGRPWPEVA